MAAFLAAKYSGLDVSVGSMGAIRGAWLNRKCVVLSQKRRCLVLRHQRTNNLPTNLWRAVGVSRPVCRSTGRFTPGRSPSWSLISLPLPWSLLEEAGAWSNRRAHF
jgi:hypothetical protein